MLFLNKLLPLFVLPVGIATWLLLFAFWKRKRWPAFTAVGLLYVCSIPFTCDRLTGWLETRQPAVPPASVAPADAIVVLGGILGPRVAPGLLPNFSDSVERFEAGVVLLGADKAPWLVFTGALVPGQAGAWSEGEELRRLAIGRGAPAEKILVTSVVGNTADEARAVAALMKERGWKKIILVTTAWHMPRAAWLFRRAGVDCTLFPVDFRADPNRPFVWGDLLPKTDVLGNTETMVRELYGNLFYRIFR